jgi:hypothetical protein
MRALLIVCVISLLGSTSANAARYQADLEAWISRDLTPYVTQKLSSSPRFRNESIRFVVLADENPQSASNSLAMSIRDRLRDSASQDPGLKVIWHRDVSVAAESGNIDCTKNQVHYYIGVEVSEDRGGLINVDVRALDVEDQSWVAGFSQSWRGYPDAMQRRQLQQTEIDRSFRGRRDAPFDESQFDLLAAQLAHELGCSLLRQTAGEYVLSGKKQQSVEAAESAMLELVSNNLADFRALQFSMTVDDANAVIEGKAHQIDDELYQYWVTITPSLANSDLPTISANAYIRVQEKYSAAALIPAIHTPMARSDTHFVGTLRVVEMRNDRLCQVSAGRIGASQVFNSRYSSAAIDCFALEVAPSSDSVLFFLNHQLNYGLVRLSGQPCDARTDAKIARMNEQLRFPLPIDALLSDSWTAAEGWQLNPDEDTYYVIATTNNKAARALSRHIKQLPNRCSAAMRSGLEGRDLQHWMDQFASIAERWKQSIDWQAIRVKNIY